jgi:hypothetical protein
VRRLLLATAAVLATLTATARSAPPGATARCRDGTYSYSAHRSGTCSHHGGVAVWLTGGATATPGRTVLLAPRTRTAGCRRGVEPDRTCSPGAYYSGLTTAVICSSSFRTGTIRDVPEAEKHAVEREYGMPPRAYGRTIEIDHIVPLELGGSNDIANLFPEPGGGADSYHLKDRVENAAHDAVCAGRIGLAAAREAIARDWVGLDRRLLGAGG